MLKKKRKSNGQFYPNGLPWDMRSKEDQEKRQLAIDRVIKGGESMMRVSNDLKIDRNLLRQWVTQIRTGAAVPSINRVDYSVPQQPEEAIKNFLIDQALSVAPTLARLRKSAAKSLGEAHESFALIIHQCRELLRQGFQVVEVDGELVKQTLTSAEIKSLSTALKSSAPELAALHGWSYGTYRPDRLSKTQDLHNHNHLHLSSRGGKGSGPKNLKPAEVMTEVQAAMDCQFTVTDEISSTQLRLLESAEE